VFVKHLNYEFDLPRWQNTYRITHLTPGESYYLKVLAKNAVGWSEYSDYNSINQSVTATASPDQPTNPHAVGAEWGTMTLTSTLPYNNGSSIHQFHLQHRVVQAFSKGLWSSDVTFLMESGEVRYVEEKEIEEKDGKGEEVEENGKRSDSEDDEEKKGEMVSGKQKLLSGNKSSSKLRRGDSRNKSSNHLPSRNRQIKLATGRLELTKELLNTHIEASDSYLLLSQPFHLLLFDLTHPPLPSPPPSSLRNQKGVR
jgi:hypothetical protein